MSGSTRPLPCFRGSRMPRRRQWCSSTADVEQPFRDPHDRRKDLSTQGLDVPAGVEFLAPAVHYVQLLAAVVVVTGVRISSEDVLEVPLR
jgi:hypothetical protein